MKVGCTWQGRALKDRGSKQRGGWVEFEHNYFTDTLRFLLLIFKKFKKLFLKTGNVSLLVMYKTHYHSVTAITAAYGLLYICDCDARKDREEKEKRKENLVRELRSATQNI